MATSGLGVGVASDRLNELRELVTRENPFWRRRLEAMPDLPPLTKLELVNDQERNPPFGTNLTYPLDRYTQMHQTSGTTGPPLRVLDTAEDWAWWRERFAHTLTVCGVGPGDKVALTYSFGPHVQFWAAKEGLEEVGAMAVPLGGMGSSQRLQTIDEIGATAIWCTPTYALRLLEVAVEQRLESALDSVERVICTGEPGASLPAVRARIEEGFGARCYDHAGLTEAGPFGYPCSDGHGLHVDESEFLIEIVDEDLRPTPEGERGELLVTPLRRTGFPVLRYRTGDAVVNTEHRCPADHPDRWLPGGIVGRTDDMVVIRGMNVFPSAIEQILRESDGVGEFRITFYTEPSAMDEVKVEVELADALEARTIQARLRQRLGLRVRIVPLKRGILPVQRGKARRVVDLRA
jgi:phenylacetate-CoA ligase